MTDATIPAELRSESLGHAYLVALSRPQKRNALTDALCRSLAAELTRVAAVPATRAILLTGDGGHFSVGGDLNWLVGMREQGSAEQVAAGIGAFQDLIRTVVALPVPVIALMSGSAAGFGLDLALACDYRIAADTAQLTSAFARMGLVPDGGSSATLRSLAPAGAVFRFLATGEVLTSREAHTLGIIDEVVAESELLNAGTLFVERIAAQPASSITAIKSLLRRTDIADIDAALEAEGAAQLAAARGADFGARAHAFLNRKKA